MSFLADDLLEGRDTGSRGYDIAALYVATRFEAAGLEPAGDEGSWYQWFPLAAAKVVPEGCKAVLLGGDGERTLEFGEDYLMWGTPGREKAEVEAPLVFVGYGVTAPELDYDDYAGLDVSGKILVMLPNAPPWFPHDQRALYASGESKYRNAVDRGAVGVLRIYTPERVEKRPWSRVRDYVADADMAWVNEAGEIQGTYPELRVRALLPPEVAASILATGPRSAEEIYAAAKEEAPGSFDLPLQARLTSESRCWDLVSCNVAGLLPGSDPDLQDQVVVFTAHLDHLGIGVPADGDSIYNGAYDNASGVAVLLEVAQAIAELPGRPRRSLLFLAVTGEEKGLLGSEVFAERPTIAPRVMVGSINLDMFLMQHPLLDVVAFGAEHSTMGATLEQVASGMGIQVSPDPIPDEVIFVRSDQYSLVRKGIPSVFLVGGFETGDPDVDGRAQYEEWDRTVYHRPGDDMSQVMDFEAGARFAELNLRLGLQIADADAPPKWIPGDLFGDRFGKGGP